jgi:hypothetical protein
MTQLWMGSGGGAGDNKIEWGYRVNGSIQEHNIYCGELTCFHGA